MLKRLETTVSLLLWSSVVVVFIFLLIYQVPNFFGVKTYVVLSGSMEPVINVGAVEYINTNDRDVEEGDIIAFHASNRTTADIITHRVIGVDEEGNFRTKGDANRKEDEGTISKSEVFGTYVFQIPKLGFLLEAIGHKGKIIIVCVLGGMFILSNVLQSLVIHQEKEKEEKEKEDTQEGIPEDVTVEKEVDANEAE